MKNKNFSIKLSLIAPCGMNCGICYAYLREKKPCRGCLTKGNDKVNHCVVCRIKNCHKLNDKKLKFCFDCDQFPCPRLKQLDKRYRVKYHMSMLENLENIKELGIRHFVRQEKSRWLCPQCQGIICVHKEHCLFCGNKRQ